MRHPGGVALLALLTMLVACAQPLPTPTPAATATVPPSTPTATTPPLPPTATPVTPANLVTQEDYALYILALDIVRLLAEEDTAALVSYAAPEGVTFSPNIYLDLEDLTFAPEQLPALKDDPTPYQWGFEAGSGLPIVLPFTDYAARFLHDRDYFHAPQIALDTRLGHGADIDNLAQVWPTARFVEFHYPGSEQYGGLDWASLRLVFIPVGPEHDWRLRGVFHDAWTP